MTGRRPPDPTPAAERNARATADAGGAARECLRCGRGFAGKPGRLVGGRPVCPACAPHFREAVPCGRCGRPTRRPMRAGEGQGLLVCTPCGQRGTHATCRVCARHRRVARRLDGGGALCPACAGDTPAVRACPDCGRATPGAGAAPCRACDLRRRIRRRSASNAGALGLPWVRRLFEEFCAWDGLPHDAPALPRCIDAYAAFFARIDRGCPERAALDQDMLLRLFRPEDLRRQARPVRFLAERLPLAWDHRRVADAAEERRIEAILDASAREPWGRVLSDYRRRLAAGGALAPKTVRVYLTAAAGLLAHAKASGERSLGHDEVDRYLRRNPGARASLQRFLGEFGHPQHPKPPPTRAAARRRRAADKATLRGVDRLLERLSGPIGTAKGRAVLAAAISKLYALPLERVLSLTPADARISGGAVTLWPDGPALVMAPVIAGAMRRLADREGRFLFPGRGALRPLSPDTVRHHLAD